MDRRAAFRAAMNAGTVAAVLSLVPIKGSFAFALPFAGFLCVLLYRRYSGEEPSPALGLRLGAWTGLAGFGIFILIATISTLGFHGENEIRDAMIQAVHQAQSRYTDPESKQVLDDLLTPSGLAMLMVLGSAFMCVLFSVLSGVGGALSALLLRRKSPPQ